MTKIAVRMFSIIGGVLAVLALAFVLAPSAYAEGHATLTVSNGSHGGSVLIDCVLGESDAAESIKTGYLAALYDESSDSYLLDGDKLYAIAANQASSYTDEQDLNFDSIFYDGWLDIDNWGTVDADGTFYAVWESDFSDDPTKLHHHVWKYSSFDDLAIKKGSFTEGGYYYNECELCGTKSIAMPWPSIDSVKLSPTSCTYTGKQQKPNVTLSSSDGPLPADQYTVTYSNNTNVGTATVKVVLNSKFYEGSKTLSFKINKAANPLKVTPKTATVKYAKVKKKAQTLKVSKVLAISKAQSKVTYAKKSGNKKIVINKNTGKVTVKKGLKKGAYKVQVAVKADGTANYKAATKTATFTVKVK